MDIQILKTGAVVIGHKGQTWLFEAPRGVGEELKSLGIVPGAILLTQVAAPGMADLGGINTVRQIPLRGDGLEAEAIKAIHGWDYVVSTDDGASVLVTVRGDVSAEEVAKHDFAIIGNKYRANAFDDSVITRPWAAGAYHVAPKVYGKLSEANPSIRGIEPKVTLSQANLIARWADGMERAESRPENTWAAAIAMFKRTHTVKDGKWERKGDSDEEMEKAMMPFVCPECGYRMESEDAAPVCPKCDVEMVRDRRRERRGGGIGIKAFPNEHACRIRQPGEFQENSFRRIQRGATPGAGPRDGKQISIIIGRPKGQDTTTTQSYRYPIDTWTEAQAREHCKEEGGDFEAAKPVAPKSSRDILTALKELLPDLPNMETDNLTIFKGGDGYWRWAALTSAAMWDLQDEFVTRKAMDFAVAYAAITGDRGPLRHEHIPGLDVGMCERQVRVGDYLFEAGYFFDTPFAQQARKRYQEEPGIYKVSAGLRFKENDLEDGVYRHVVIFERSATKSPAVPITMLGVNDMPLQVTEGMLKQVAEELKWPLEEVKELYERALKSKKPPEDMEALKSALQTNRDEEAVKAAIDKLSPEQRAMILKNLNSPDQDAEVKEPPEAEGLKKEVAELKEAVAAQTKALATMAEALKGGNVNQDSIQGALTELLSALPRNQAAQFAVEKTGGQVDLAAIQRQLNEIGEAVKKNANLFSFETVYDQFTSPTLNRGVQ